MGELRFPDEIVRHKVLDLIGDFALLGMHPRCEVIALKSGHALHVAAVRELLAPYRPAAVASLTRRSRSHRDRGRCLGNDRPVAYVDVRSIMEILPHRYPMLLIDRITELEPQKRAVGYKNITFNEPFFTGHFPNNPVMPGVLIIEAMAQLGGSAILEPNSQTTTCRISPSVDKVKFRRPVVPGDKLVMEVERAVGAHEHRPPCAPKRESTTSSCARANSHSRSCPTRGCSASTRRSLHM